MTTVPAVMLDKVVCGDCAKLLYRLPAASVDLIVTSPPYPGQKGDTRTVSEWLGWFDGITAGMVRVLGDNGVLALNIMFKRDGGWFDGRLLTEIPVLLQRHSLHLIDVYVFGKPNPAPNGNVERNDPPAWEPVFLVAKSPDYYFRPYRAPYKPKSMAGNGTVYSTRKENVPPHPDGARQSNLLIMSASADQNRPKAEGQSFPLALPERFILQHTRPGGIVLDPFAGAGTTCRAAQLNGRRYIGIELKPAEADKARRWLATPFQPALSHTNGAAMWSTAQ